VGERNGTGVFERSQNLRRIHAKETERERKKYNWQEKIKVTTGKRRIYMCRLLLLLVSSARNSF
jgi:hypothetical protein